MQVLLVVYDNGSYIPWFPQGLAYIASILKQEGHQVKIYNQDVHHYPDTHLTAYLDQNQFDVIGISTIAGYYQHKKLMAIADAIGKSKNRPEHFIIGGHGPSPEPDYFLKKTGADIAVIGEGEETIVELLDALAEHKSLKEIKGIAYRDGSEVVINPRRELIQDIDSIPMPAYELFPIEVYRLLRFPHMSSSDFSLPLLSGRGCTFTCNFCYRLDEGFRPRSAEAIIEEIKYLKKNYRINYIGFADELLMSSRERTAELCEKFLAAKLDIKWDCNGRLNYASPDLLKLMKESGCLFINYGIEAFDDTILRNMNKALTTKQITRGIEATLAADISPGLNIIFGNIGENKETLRKGMEFLLKYDDGAQLRTIRPVTPYPGSPLYYHAIEKGLLEGVEDFYQNKHLNSDLVAVNFTDMSDDEFHEALFETNKILLENHYKGKKELMIEQARELYLERDTNFRGFRQT
ncbi:MAG: B12-binding domain-containing radical SAM protein [Desulfobulbaceae bacterium]|nr:B12-binding domain-containing radical SAM protein [Desulfobulbaceae bacterium]